MVTVVVVMSPTVLVLVVVVVLVLIGVAVALPPLSGGQGRRMLAGFRSRCTCSASSRRVAHLSALSVHQNARKAVFAVEKPKQACDSTRHGTAHRAEDDRIDFHLASTSKARYYSGGWQAVEPWLGHHRRTAAPPAENKQQRARRAYKVGVHT